MNLLSVSKMTDKGYKVVFEKDCASVIGEDGHVKLNMNITRTVIVRVQYKL